MNRFQRRYTYMRPNSIAAKKRKNELEEVWVARSRCQMQSRCCYVTPDQHSFALLSSSPACDSPGQYQNLVAAVPHRSSITKPNPVAKPIIVSKNNVIPMAEPNRIMLPDMLTVAKQKPRPTPVQHIQHDRRILRNVTMEPKSSSTLPDESVISVSSVHDVKPTAHKESSTLPELTLDQLLELRRLYFTPCSNEEKGSQYDKAVIISSDEESKEDEFENIILRDEETLTQYHNLSKKLHISEIPRIKLVAVKSTKYKKENIELRRIDEKIVCVEYDVFDEELDKNTPVQKMRAFFSINPVADEKEEKQRTEIPFTIKSQFKISTADLQKLNQKEIEIIDGKIIENQPYLDDLRKLLRRKENAAKIKNTPNLQALYEMASKNLLGFDNNLETVNMPKEELFEMRNYILLNCKSSVEGLRRKTVKKSSKVFADLVGNTSQSLATDLLSELNKTDFK